MDFGFVAIYDVINHAISERNSLNNSEFSRFSRLVSMLGASPKFRVSRTHVISIVHSTTSISGKKFVGGTGPTPPLNPHGPLIVVL